MANRDAPNGFVPRKHLTGGTPMRMNAYAVANPTTNAFFSGDLVRLTGAADTAGIPIIEDVAVGETSVGVFAGIRFVDVNGDQQFRPFVASGVTFTADPKSPVEALVYDDPDMMFMVQVQGVLVAADIGQNMDLVVTAGNTPTGRSRYEIDQTTAGATGQVHVQQLDRLLGNALGADAKVLCLISEHQLAVAPGVAGV